MSAQITIEWGDGYVAIYPDFPERLTKELQYWHRTFERKGGQNVATGQYRQLYTLEPYVNGTEYGRKLVILPGFLHRARSILKEEGYDVTIVDKRTPAPTPDIAKAITGLRDYQIPCAYTMLMSGGGVIACPTGFGKTHLIAAVINAYSHEELLARNTPLVVVTTPDKDITFKDYEDLVKLLPDRDIGIAMSGMKRKFSDDVQVITLDSLHLLNPEDVGILIVDEVHTAASESRSDTIVGFRKALRWGVSATPDGRFDGRDKVTEGMFGPIIYRRTYKQGIADGALVPIKVYWVKAPEPSIGLHNYLTYKTHVGKYRHGVDTNANQNKIIADIMTRTPDKLQTLCIMRHLAQMDKLVPLVAGVKYVHGQESDDTIAKEAYHNLTAIDKKERRAIYADVASGATRKVMSTYVYKQGVNFPDLAVIINAGGSGSEIVATQIPGRESRLTANKSEAYLVDFWHSWDVEEKEGRTKPGPIHRDDQSRESCYTELGFDQVWVDTLDELPFLTNGNG